MKKIPYKVDAYNNQTGEYLQTMQPNQDYKFDGVDEVLEIPKMQAGGLKPKKIIVTGHTGIKYEATLDKETGLYVDPKGNYWEKNPTNNTAKVVINQAKDQEEEAIKKAIDEEKGSTANLIKKGSNYSYTPNEGIFNKANVDPRGYTTSTKRSSLWDNSKGSYEDWVKGWNTLIPGFDKLTIGAQQTKAYQFTEQNYPALITNMWLTYGNTKSRKGTGTLVDYVDGSAGARTQFLNPNEFNQDRVQINGIKPLNQHLTDPHIKTPVIDILKKSSELPQVNTAISPVNNNSKVLGTLTNKDYLGLPLSNAYNRAMQTYLPYYKQAQFKPLQAIGVDPRAALAQVDAQSNAALQGINQNSTVGQSVVQQILANAQRNKQQILSQYDNQNQQIFQNVENQNTQGITNTLNQQENNKYQYHDDLSRIKALQDETLFNLDISAANNQAQLDRTANDFILNDISNPNFQLKKRGNNYDVTQVDTADFKTQDTATKDWIKDLIKENEALKKKVTAKYGMKKKKC